MQPVWEPQLNQCSNLADSQYLGKNAHSVVDMLQAVGRINLINRVISKWQRIFFQINRNVCTGQTIKIYKAFASWHVATTDFKFHFFRPFR